MSKSMKSTEVEQHARFIEAARVLGCDEDESAFDEKLKVIARSSLAEKKSDKSRESTSKPGQP